VGAVVARLEEDPIEEDLRDVDLGDGGLGVVGLGDAGGEDFFRFFPHTTSGMNIISKIASVKHATAHCIASSSIPSNIGTPLAAGPYWKAVEA